MRKRWQSGMLAGYYYVTFGFTADRRSSGVVRGDLPSRRTFFSPPLPLPRHPSRYLAANGLITALRSFRIVLNADKLQALNAQDNGEYYGNRTVIRRDNDNKKWDALTQQLMCAAPSVDESEGDWAKLGNAKRQDPAIVMRVTCMRGGGWRGGRVFRGGIRCIINRRDKKRECHERQGTVVKCSAIKVRAGI